MTTTVQNANISEVAGPLPPGSANTFVAFEPVMLSPKRSVGGIVADVVVREEHIDASVITDHPVEFGAQISDHAYPLPAILSLLYGWSGGSKQNTSGDLFFLQGVYAQLRALKDAAITFDVYTGKRVYQNMLIEELRSETTVHTENSLLIHVRCREVQIANTSTVTIPDAAVMANPQSTGPVTQLGKQQATQVPAPQYVPAPISKGISGVER